MDAGTFLFGSKGKAKQLKLTDKMQEGLLEAINEGLTKGEGPLADLFGKFNEENFNKGVAKPALKQFQEEILPSLSEKFISSGTAGGSGFRRAQLKAGTDLQSKLAELMYQAQNQHTQNRIGGLNTAVGKQTVENIYQPATKGAVQGAIEGIAQGATKKYLPG